MNFLAGAFEEICESLSVEQCALVEEVLAIAEAERAVDLWLAAAPGRSAQRDIFEGSALVMAVRQPVKLWRYTLNDVADRGPQEITGATPAALREAVLKHFEPAAVSA